MNHQNTSNELEKVYESEKSISYVTSCSCLDSDHRMLIDITKYKNENYTPTFSLFFQVSKYLYNENFLIHLWNRMKMAFKILFFCDISVEEEFVFRGEEQVKAVINALNNNLYQK